MEKSKLKIICGLKVVGASFEINEEGVSFEKGINLAIHNKIKLVGYTRSNAYILIGKVVVDVYEEEDTITIMFENNFAIQIDMRDEAYTGPEAMELHVPGEPIVIWN